MTGLRILPITLDKDAWENVPSIMYKSFHALSTNMSNIKKWADKQEEKAKAASELQQQIEGRIDATGEQLKATQGRLQELTTALQESAEENRHETDALAACIGQLLQSTRALFSNLGHAFGVDLTWSPEEQSAMAALQGGEGGMEELRTLGCGLEAHLDSLKVVFDQWGAWRDTQEKRQDSMQGTIEELRLAAERTRERLLTWREMLKESSHAIESLGASLAGTQGVVQELQATQVQSHDVEEAVNRRAYELEELHDQTEKRVDGISECVQHHMLDVEALIKETRRQTDDRITEHGLQVSQTLERSLNPVNAYLNTMHVKADVVRVELDNLNALTPKLSSSIEDVAAELRRSDTASSSRAVELGDRVDTLVQSVTDLGAKGEAQNAALSDGLGGLSRDLGEQIGVVRSSLGETAHALESTRRGELASLTKDLAFLEQKVAKWVHAHPLPAKVSEARLYALEARLGQETDARLHLEYSFKDRLGARQSGGAFTPRSTDSQNFALPQLPGQKAQAIT